MCDLIVPLLHPCIRSGTIRGRFLELSIPWLCMVFSDAQFNSSCAYDESGEAFYEHKCNMFLAGEDFVGYTLSAPHSMYVHI